MYLIDIKLGNPSNHSGHVVYKSAYANFLKKKIIVKKNKHGESKYSRFEVALTDIARLFSIPKLTASQYLVYQKQTLFGLGVEHIGYCAQYREGDNACFFTIDEQACCHPVSAKTSLPPVYFLDQFAHGFFAQLYQKELEGLLEFDWAALANMLATSYTLEEDDLHKGNIGFYIVQGAAKPRVVFFSIDHDLKLAGSIMSYYCPRIQNKHTIDGAYTITARDLLNFPYIQDSQNYYWPTRWRWLTSSFDHRVYLHGGELQAFAALADRDEFKYEKWLAFYKHVLIPPSRLRTAYLNSFNPDKPEDQALIDLFTDAIVERQAQMRAVLFSIPEFRHFLTQIKDTDKLRILNEIEPEESEKRREIKKQMETERVLLDTFNITDTPLHAAVRLGDYRYQSTWKYFKQFAQVRNENNETALDIAIQHAKKTPPRRGLDIRRDFYAISRHLYRLDAGCNVANQAYVKQHSNHIRGYLHYSSYVRDAGRADSIEALVDVLKKIGQEDSYCLKMKKQVAVLALGNFLKARQKKPETERVSQSDLCRLFNAVNGFGDPTLHKPLQYIRQLRHSYWIIQKIRSLIGGSATQVRMSALIRAHLPWSLKRLLAPTFFGCFGFRDSGAQVLSSSQGSPPQKTP